jgi:secondary thiamine-phosphate synthase enzyme
MWVQKEFSLPAKSRGFHLVTSEVVQGLPELKQLKVGVLHLFILHTSASLTINENADPDVRVDMETFFNRIAPEKGVPIVHTLEGPDDMPAHVKASLLGASVSMPIRDGSLALGTWQGIYLCEHRNRGGSRRLIATLHGQAAE